MEPVSLKQWRAAQTPPATLVSVAKALDVSHSLVLEWEKGTRSPGVELALRLEKLTGGAVPIESWGYTRDLVDLMRSAVERRDTDLAAPISSPVVDLVQAFERRATGS